MKNEPDKILSDREKLDVWNQLCIKNRWASEKRELDKWLANNGVHFTGGGSCLKFGILEYKIDNRDNAKIVINGSKGEEFATFVLQALTGILLFPTTEIEMYFWELAKERLWEDFKSELPKQIVPKYIKDHLWPPEKKPKEIK